MWRKCRLQCKLSVRGYSNKLVVTNSTSGGDGSLQEYGYHHQLGLLVYLRQTLKEIAAESQKVFAVPLWKNILELNNSEQLYMCPLTVDQRDP